MSRPNLRNALAELEAEARAAGKHPTPDELIDYQEEKLERPEAARVAEHLIFCAECAATVLDLEAGLDLEAERGVQLADPSLARTAAEEDEDWQEILSRLPAAAPIHPPIPFKSQARAGRISPRWGARQLAAIFGLLAAGLAIWVISLLGSRNVPRANAYVADLAPIEEYATRPRSRDTLPVTEVPAGMEMVVLLLAHRDLRSFESYAAELLNAQGETRWRQQGLVMAREGGFSLALPIASLQKGELEIRLYGQNGEQREIIATYKTRIVLPGSP